MDTSRLATWLRLRHTTLADDEGDVLWRLHDHLLRHPELLQLLVQQQDGHLQAEERAGAQGRRKGLERDRAHLRHRAY